MDLETAKKQFVAAWGSFGSNWGINRTMAQIHALLLVSHHPLHADAIMEELNISRGNANMNLRELILWGLVERVIIPGERKEFFVAEKDIWKVARTIIKERKRRELEPMLRFLDELQVPAEKNNVEIEAFHQTIGSIQKFSRQANKTLDTLIRSDENWFWNHLIKLLVK